MKFLDFLLTLAALVSLGVATYLFATDQHLGQSIDSLTKNRISLFNEQSETDPTSDPQSTKLNSLWKYIIIHHSGTKSGNAKIFDRYHRREKKMPKGIAYHFVIGNGTKSANGEIEISSRWHKKIAGPHCYDQKMNEQSIAICLVGDFEKSKPTQTQVRRLVDLVWELRKDYNIPLENIRSHKDVDPGLTDCPGKNFSMELFKSRLSSKMP